MAFEMPSSCASLRRGEVGLPSIGGPLVTASAGILPQIGVSMIPELTRMPSRCHRNVGDVLSFPEARSTQCAIHRLVVLVNDNVLE